MAEEERPEGRPRIRTRDLAALMSVVLAATAALAMTAVKLMH